jgi:hypothetical protein
MTNKLHYGDNLDLLREQTATESSVTLLNRRLASVTCRATLR